MAKILLAGEDLMALGSMEATLEAEDYEVITVTDGLEAHETTLAEEPDLVFLEVSMPIFNGLETCEMIREDPGIPKELPVILLATDDVDIRKMERTGVTDLLPKDHMSVDLRDLVVKHLGDKAGKEPEA